MIDYIIMKHNSDDKIKKAYYDPGSGFVGIDKLYRKLKNDGEHHYGKLIRPLFSLCSAKKLSFEVQLFDTKACALSNTLLSSTKTYFSRMKRASCWHSTLKFVQPIALTKY